MGRQRKKIAKAANDRTEKTLNDAKRKEEEVNGLAGGKRRQHCKK